MKRFMTMPHSGAMAWLGVAVAITACAARGTASPASDDDTTATEGGEMAAGGGGQGGSSTMSVSSSTASSGGAGGAGGATSVSSSSSSSTGSGQGPGKPTNCGNGKLDDGEACDDTLFGGKSCQDFGLGGGTLLCNSHCAVVLTKCTPLETCGNGVDDDVDGKMDCEDEECKMDAACTDPCGKAAPLMIPAYDFGSTAGAPEVLAPACATNSGAEKVFSFTAPKDANYSVELMSYFAPMVLAVRSACGDVKTELACSALAAFDQKVVVQATKGTTYYVIADAEVGQPDDFSINIVETN